MPSINFIFKEAYIVLELKTEKLQKRKDLLKFMLNPDFDFVNKRYKKNYSELESFHNYAKLCHFSVVIFCQFGIDLESRSDSTDLKKEMML